MTEQHPRSVLGTLSNRTSYLPVYPLAPRAARCKILVLAVSRREIVLDNLTFAPESQFLHARLSRKSLCAIYSPLPSQLPVRAFWSSPNYLRLLRQISPRAKFCLGEDQESQQSFELDQPASAIDSEAAQGSESGTHQHRIGGEGRAKRKRKAEGRK